MKNLIHIAAIAVALLIPSTIEAQSAVDAYQLTPYQLRGTARFVAMGGAFTSLGGDLSSLGQNPAGLALYRSSDLGFTFDVGRRDYSATTSTGSFSNGHWKAYFDNVGYAGVIRLDGAMKNFNWGITYNRNVSFDRRIQGYNDVTSGSLTNYIASFSNGVSSDYLVDAGSNDPYTNGEDWLSALAYNSFMINNPVDQTEYYQGLYKSGTSSDALYAVHEWGYEDEYNIDFAGNVSDKVFWGIGVGIVDYNYNCETEYSESMSGANVYDYANDDLTDGDAYFNLYNSKHISGTGANLKIGVIVRPIEALRIGVAVHTPTWMGLTHTGYGDVEYEYNTDLTERSISGYNCTPTYEYRSRLHTPWRFMVGASTVLGGKAIISADYERIAYDDMRVYYESSSFFGGTFVKDEAVCDDIKNYFQAADVFRLGAEYRLTGSLSARAGYNYQHSNARSTVLDGNTMVYTAGTDPSYTFDKDVHNICVGIGYRSGMWYFDATFQHTTRKSVYHAYTPWSGNVSPSASVSANNNCLVISTGLRF